MRLAYALPLQPPLSVGLVAPVPAYVGWYLGDVHAAQVEPYRVACPNHIEDVPDVDMDQGAYGLEEDGEEGYWGGEEEEPADHRTNNLLRQ